MRVQELKDMLDQFEGETELKCIKMTNLGDDMIEDELILEAVGLVSERSKFSSDQLYIGLIFSDAPEVLDLGRDVLPDEPLKSEREINKDEEDDKGALS